MSRMSDGTAPGTYGVVERGAASTDAARIAERIRLAGFAVVPGGFSSAEVADSWFAARSVMARQVEEFGGSDRLLVDRRCAHRPLPAGV